MPSEHKFSFEGEDFDSEEDDDVMKMDDSSSLQVKNTASPSSSMPYETPLLHSNRQQVAETGSLRRQPNSVSGSAFPVDGKSLLPAICHSLDELISTLPDRITYHTLTVKLDDGTVMKIPRRDLHDAKMQAMAEDEMTGEHSTGDGAMEGLGAVDVKTGIYEGGFKSWESSIDLVKELAIEDGALWDENVVELGCGTALPSLALFQWHIQRRNKTLHQALRLGLADYNPPVLRLVTLPNLILSWASAQITDAFSNWEDEGELLLSTSFIDSFLASLQQGGVEIFFFSGAWSPEFVDLVQLTMGLNSKKQGEINEKNVDPNAKSLLIIGAESIYSPFALRSFADTAMSMLQCGSTEEKRDRRALVAAKKFYFGVGGSLEDLCILVRKKGGTFETKRQEDAGVSRAVIEVWG